MSLWKIKDELGNPSRPQKTMFLVSVYFDPLTNRTLQKFIGELAEKTGNKFMIENNVPPHMTFLQIQTRNAQKELEEVMTRLDGKLQKIPLVFTACGGEIPNVIYAKVKLSEELKAQIDLVYEEFSKIADIKINPHYLPEIFFPHVTLAKTLSREAQADGLEYIQRNFSMFTGELNEAGLSCGKPPVHLVRFKVDS